MLKKWTRLCMLMSAFGTATIGCADNSFYGPYNSSSSCCYAPSSHWFVDGEFLYWEAQEDGLGYLKYTPGLPNPASPVIAGPLRSREVAPHSKWEPGFRVGVGYKSDCDKWYTALTYTYFYDKASSSVVGPSIPGFQYGIETRSLVATGEVFVSDRVDSFAADGRWKLNYNIIDWEVGARYCLSRNITFKPFFGLRGAFIDQSYSNDVSGLFASTPPLAPTSSFDKNERAKNDYHAGGIRTGFDLMWDWFDGFGIYAKASGSLLYGQFRIDDRFNETVTTFFVLPPSITEQFSDETHYKSSRVRANLEGALGIQWAKTFCNNNRLTIRLGYEIIQWFNQNQLPSRLILSDTSSGDLGLQGLQFMARYAF